MRPITIRAAVREDASDVARVHVQCWRESYRGLVPDDEIERRTVALRVEHFFTWLERDGNRTFVAVDPASGVLGFATGEPSDREPGFETVLNGLYVRESAQRRGAGTALMGAFAAAMRTDGYRSVALWVLAGNAKARAFYEARGAEFVRTDPSGPWDSVIYGWRDLTALRYDAAAETSRTVLRPPRLAE